ncbi:hypothetical protein F4777DRAFT_323555 [Nemania sp. FL0916]|nr:hypothetical protein F4777DRAFT_323555 [Nemania sp. FL0916]
MLYMPSLSLPNSPETSVVIAVRSGITLLPHLTSDDLAHLVEYTAKLAGEHIEVEIEVPALPLSTTMSQAHYDQPTRAVAEADQRLTPPPLPPGGGDHNTVGGGYYRNTTEKKEHAETEEILDNDDKMARARAQEQKYKDDFLSINRIASSGSAFNYVDIETAAKYLQIPIANPKIDPKREPTYYPHQIPGKIYPVYKPNTCHARYLVCNPSRTGIYPAFYYRHFSHCSKQDRVPAFRIRSQHATLLRYP